MADTENRNIDFKDASKESARADKSHNEKKPHKKKSFAWWAGVIVLILISITFILPATGISSLFVDSSIRFGSYGGKPIEYANGSDMYTSIHPFTCSTADSWIRHHCFSRLITAPLFMRHSPRKLRRQEYMSPKI